VAQRHRIAGNTGHTRSACAASLIRPVGPRAHGLLLGRPPSISVVHLRWTVGSNSQGYIMEGIGRVLTLTPFTPTIFQERGGLSSVRCVSYSIAVAPVRWARAPHRRCRSLRARLHEDAARPMTSSSSRRTAPSSGNARLYQAAWLLPGGWTSTDVFILVLARSDLPDLSARWTSTRQETVVQIRSTLGRF
jgi:hypothetical protein